MELIYAILLAIGAFGVGSVTFAVIFRKIGYNARKRVAESEIGSAEEEAKRIRDDGAKQAETMKKEALLSAKEEILKQRNEAENELKESGSNPAILIPRLINHYFWLVDYYVNSNDDGRTRASINEILLKIKYLDPKIHELYII